MSWRSLVLCRGSYQAARSHQAGFGLIELMVSIAVMAIVSSIILIRHESFNSATLLRSQAYEVALRVREVQFSAVSASGDGSGDFNSVNGVYFDSTAGLNGVYKSFRDGDGDYFFDAVEEDGQAGVLDERFEISDIRAVGVGAVLNGDDVAIVFERPNFDAKFYEDASDEVVNATAMEIDVARRGAAGATCGEVRTVEITRTGQISVLPCP